MMPGAKPWKVWSSEDVVTLLRMRDRGATPTEMAKALDRSVESVKVKLRSPNGVCITPWTPEESAIVREMRGQGAGLAMIAARIGRTYDGVRAEVRRQADGKDTQAQWRSKEHLSSAKALGWGRFDDDRYVALCRAQGGFGAFTETRHPNGTVKLSQPIVYPSRWAA